MILMRIQRLRTPNRSQPRIMESRKEFVEAI